MERTRDRSVSEVRVNSSRLLKDGVQTGITTSNLTVVQPETMTDVITRRFYTRSRVNGDVINSPMSKVIAKNKSSNIVRWAEFYDPAAPVATRNRYRSELVNHYPTPDIMVQYPGLMAKVVNLEALAVTKAYSRVGEPDVATLTELAELRETLSFLASPVRGMVAASRRLSNYLKKFSRYEKGYLSRLSRWKTAKESKAGKREPKPSWSPPSFDWAGRRVDDVASAWLAFRYAIMPLVYTFQDIQKHLDRTEYPTRGTGRAKESDTFDETQVLDFDTAVTGTTGPYKGRREMHLNAKVVVRAGVLYIPDWSLSRQLGFQINRVPMALYEVIPLSFVTDWFHNGQEFYDALTAEFRAMQILAAWVTTEVTWDYNVDVGGISTTDSRVTFSGMATATLASGTWKRRRPASMSDVAFKFRLEINAKRVADGLALVKTILFNSRKI